MRRTTLALFITLTLALTASPALADDGLAFPSWTPIDVWTWFLDWSGLEKIGGATSDPDGPPAPPPTEDGSTPADPGGDDSVSRGTLGSGPDVERGESRLTTKSLARWHS